MTAFTDTIGFSKGTASIPASRGQFSLIQVELDFAAIVAARSAASATALAAADTLQIINLPAKCAVLQAGLDVITAETTNTTATFDLGFTGGSPAAANVFGNDVASNSTGVTGTGLAAPLVFASADTIDLLLNTAAPTDAVVQVWAIVVDLTAK